MNQHDLGRIALGAIPGVSGAAATRSAKLEVRERPHKPRLTVFLAAAAPRLRTKLRSP